MHSPATLSTLLVINLNINMPPYALDRFVTIRRIQPCYVQSTSHCDRHEWIPDPAEDISKVTPKYLSGRDILLFLSRKWRFL